MKVIGEGFRTSTEDSVRQATAVLTNTTKPKLLCFFS